MNITHSLIYVPETAFHVKKSLLSEISEMSTPQNSLLRHVNKKNAEPAAPRRATGVNVKKTDQKVPRKIVGGKVYVKNLTGGPVLINIPTGHDPNGAPQFKQIIINKFQRKEAFRKEDLESFEFQDMYDRNKICDVDEATYREESEGENEENPIEERTQSAPASSKTLSAGGKEIKITEDLNAGESSVLVDVEDSEVSKSTQALMEGDDGDSSSLADLLPQGDSIQSRKRPGGRPLSSGSRKSVSRAE